MIKDTKRIIRNLKSNKERHHKKEYNKTNNTHIAKYQGTRIPLKTVLSQSVAVVLTVSAPLVAPVVLQINDKKILSDNRNRVGHQYR